MPIDPLSEVYQQLGTNRFSSIAARASMRVSSADAWSYIEVDLSGRTVAADSDLEFALSVTKGARFANSAVNDDVLPYWSRARVGRVCRIEDFTTPAEFRGTRLFGEILEPLCLTQLTVMTLRVSEQPRRVACIALGREHKRFDDAEIDELGRLALCLPGAQRTADLLEQLRLGGRSVRGTRWARLGHMVLSQDGFVRETSADAGAWVREFFGPAPRFDCRLPSDLWTRIRSSVTDPLRKSIESAHGDDQLAVYVLPEPSGALMVLLERLMLVSDGEMRRALGLGTKQCQLVRALLEYEELELPDIAKRMGCNKSTVETTNKRVLARLGIKRRTQLRKAVEDRLALWAALENAGAS